MNEYGELVEWYWRGETETLGDNLSPPLCPPQILQGISPGTNPGLSSERKASNRLEALDTRNYSHKNKTLNQYEEHPPRNTALPTRKNISNQNSVCTTTFPCNRQGGASCGSVWRETVACRPTGSSSLARTPTHSCATSDTLQTPCNKASLWNNAVYEGLIAWEIRTPFTSENRLPLLGVWRALAGRRNHCFHLHLPTRGWRLTPPCNLKTDIK